jgi:hypothetical protein
MPLENYFVRCYLPNCPREAEYKIASLWSDGMTSELKTYSLCCEECLPKAFQLSHQKQQACRTAVVETLLPPGIYRIRRGLRDHQLERLGELEGKLARSFPPPLFSFHFGESK